MNFQANIRGIKLFAIAIIFSLLLFYIYYETSLPLLTEFMILAIGDVVISVISIFFMDDFDPAGYYLVFFWASFTILIFEMLFFHSIPVEINSILKMLIISILFSAISGTIFILMRVVSATIYYHQPIPKNGSGGHDKNSFQNFTGSIYYAVLISFILLYGPEQSFYFLHPSIFLTILFLAYIASLFYAGISINLGLNLSVLFIFLISFLPVLVFHQIIPWEQFLELMLILLAASFITFYLMYAEEVGSEGNYTGNVVSSPKSNLKALIVIFIAWLVSSIILHISVSSGTVLLILLPVSIGSFLSDAMHGRKANKMLNKQRDNVSSIGVIGGVGMADGLWLLFIPVLVLYFLLIV